MHGRINFVLHTQIKPLRLSYPKLRPNWLAYINNGFFGRTCASAKPVNLPRHVKIIIEAHLWFI